MLWRFALKALMRYSLLESTDINVNYCSVAAVVMLQPREACLLK
jgi:hypothetical protein